MAEVRNNPFAALPRNDLFRFVCGAGVAVTCLCPVFVPVLAPLLVVAGPVIPGMASAAAANALIALGGGVWAVADQRA